jgi:Acetyltransferase (GNAT) domain
MISSDRLSRSVVYEFVSAKELAVARKELPTDIKFETSCDMQYLQQYFFVREYAYRLDLRLQQFSGVEDEVDQYSQFIIARKGHFVLGGARLTVIHPNACRPLSLESDNFVLRKMFPVLHKYSYCELGRTAVLPQYRSGDILSEIFRISAVLAASQGCKFLFGVSPYSVARRFRNVYNSLGYPTEIYENIKAPVKPVHEHLKIKFLSTQLAPNEMLPLEYSPNLN